MSVLWSKAIRDLRGESLRSASIVLALALGIAGFLAVLSAYAILTRALDEGYAATDPPSAILAVEGLDDDLVRAAAETPGVQSAEARRMVRGQIAADLGRWRNLVLFVRPDFASSRIGTISPESGPWPPGPGEIAVERDALSVAGVEIGDAVEVRTDSGVQRTLRVSGSVHDVGQAQARMENLVYGYVTSETLRALGEDPYYDELVIRVAERPLDEAHIRQIAASVGAALEERGRHVTRLSVPEPGKHPHAKIMGLLLLSMAVFGLFTLALSGVIVFNVLTALLAGQIRQIGVMKALGGTRLQIAGVYLLEALLLGAAALLAALPIGLAGSRWLCDWMAVFLNFDIESYAIPLWTYALVLTVSLAVPVLSALLPVWLGTRVPVREALAARGRQGRIYGTSVVDRALARVAGPSRVWLLAVRNVGRDRVRVALTLVTLVASGIFFLAALGVRQSMIHTLDRLFDSWRSDLTITLAEGTPAEAAESAVRAIGGVVAAEGWLAVGESPAVMGIEPDSKLIVFDLAEGRGLDGSPRAFVANTTLHASLGGPAVGSEVRLQIGGEDVAMTLSGVTREPFSAPTAYVARAFFDVRPEAGTTNSLRIALAKDADLDAVRSDIDAQLAQKGLRSLKVATEADNRYVFDAHMEMIYVFLVVVSCILGGVGGLGLLTTASLNVTERRREMGVLRAIGATPARVIQLVVLEGAIIAALAWGIAALASRPASELIGNLLLGLMFRDAPSLAVAIDPWGGVIWLGISLVGSAAASVWPAWQASRVPVREALTYE